MHNDANRNLFVWRHTGVRSDWGCSPVANSLQHALPGSAASLPGLSLSTRETVPTGQHRRDALHPGYLELSFVFDHS